MMSNNDNLCSICEVEQQCCKEMGLKLSKDEYERHFKSHPGRFDVIHYSGMVVVFPRDDRPCPYLTGTGCGIYLDRPVDCRLYPYELNRMEEKRSRVEAVLYDQTDCPHKEELFIPIEEAEELVRELAREVYGPGKPVFIKYRPGKKPRRAFGIFNPLIAKLYRVFKSEES